MVSGQSGTRAGPRLVAWETICGGVEPSRIATVEGVTAQVAFEILLLLLLFRGGRPSYRTSWYSVEFLLEDAIVPAIRIFTSAEHRPKFPARDLLEPSLASCRCRVGREVGRGSSAVRSGKPAQAVCERCSDHSRAATAIMWLGLGKLVAVATTRSTSIAGCPTNVPSTAIIVAEARREYTVLRGVLTRLKAGSVPTEKH